MYYNIYYLIQIYCHKLHMDTRLGGVFKISVFGSSSFFTLTIILTVIWEFIWQSVIVIIFGY